MDDFLILFSAQMSVFQVKKVYKWVGFGSVWPFAENFFSRRVSTEGSVLQYWYASTPVLSRKYCSTDIQVLTLVCWKQVWSLMGAALCPLPMPTQK